jgi:hypothetical protein
MKKGSWKPAGIIALVAVIGLGLAGCDNGSTPGGGRKATIIIKNQSDASITAGLEDAWDSAGGSKILSGLETKTIGANAEGTWSLECSGDRAWVNIEINGNTIWVVYDVKVGETCKFTWDSTGLNES